MQVSDIITIIEKTAPLSAAAPWDVSGVQVASRLERITGVAVMLDPLFDTLLAATEGEADFILTHHPLSMKPVFPNTVGDYTDILALLFRKGAWLYSAHTSLDGNPSGPVQWLARELKLNNTRVLESSGANGDTAAPYGYGFIGDLPEAIPYEEFCLKLRSLAKVPVWNACGPQPKAVRRIACCPGSGSSLIELAREADADIYITGDVKYHFALEANGRMPRVLDVGHFSLEEEMMRRFALQLEKELSVPVTFYHGTDPMIKE